MNKPAKNNPNFKDYLSGYSYNVGGVLLTNKDGLNLGDKLDFTCLSTPTCILSIEKITDKKAVLRKRRIAQKYNTQIDTIKFAYEWHNSFTKKRLESLFSRYFVNGFKSFCLAITPENIKGLPLYKFLLPEHLLKYVPNQFSKEQLNIGVDHYYEQWIDEIRGEFGNKCMSKADFIKYLSGVRGLIECIANAKNLTKTHCEMLTKLSNELPKEEEITADIIHSFFDSFTDDLIKSKKISQCQSCFDYFIYRKDKKFCSLLNEGKDCGKQARNKRYYGKRGKKRLPIYRKATRDLRAYYKEKGIKK
jgi:hypothetical protein